MLPIVFDLDGTLIDSLPTLTSTANALLTSRKKDLVAPSTVATFIGWGEQVFLDKLIAHAGLEMSDRAQLLADFLKYYEQLGHETVFMPGAEAALEELKRRGVPIGLCTNKPRSALEPVLATTRLGELLDVVVAGNDLKVKKPDPKPLEHCFEMLSAAPGIYVGDTHIDAECAQRAGVQFLLYTEGIRTVAVKEIPHDAKFSDFALLARLYDDLVSD